MVYAKISSAGGAHPARAAVGHVGGDHPIAHRERCNARSQGLDNADEIGAQAGRVRNNVDPLVKLEIGAVDCRFSNPNLNLTGGRLGCRNVFHPDVFRSVK